jgi:hypothetical protein
MKIGGSLFIVFNVILALIPGSSLSASGKFRLLDTTAQMEMR